MIYTIFIQQLLFGILALLFTYSIGKLIASFFDIKGNFYFRLFVTYIIGITVIVLFYSIIKAHGRTVNILLLPIIGYLLYYFRNSFTKKTRFDNKEIVRELLWSLIPFLFVFLYQSWFYFDFKNESINSFFSDFYLYGTMSDSLKSWGAESKILDMNYFFPEFRYGLLPYHYPELWLTAFFSTVLENSTVNSYYFITYPILIIIYFLGVLSLFENKTWNWMIVSILGFAVLFISGYSIPFITINSHNTWGILDISGQKLAFIYCYILLSFILLKNDQWMLGLLILTIIPIFSITFLIGIWFGIIVFCLGLFYLNKTQYTIKMALLNISIVIFLLLLYFSFYSVFKSDYSDSYAIKKVLTTGVFNNTFDKSIYLKWKIIISNIFVYSIPTIFIHIGVRFYLYITLLFLFYKTTIKYWKLILLITCVLFFGAMTKTLTSSLFDSDQFIEALSSLLIVFVVLLISEYNSYSKVMRVILFVSLFWILSINISEVLRNKKNNSQNNFTFLNSISQNIKLENNIIMYFVSKNDIKESMTFAFLGLSNDLMPLSRVSNRTIVFSIANPESYLNKGNLSYSDSFYYYSLTPINVWRNKCKNNTLKNFIEKFKIKYFYFKVGAEVPTFISEKAIKTIESTTTHSRFIITK